MSSGSSTIGHSWNQGHTCHSVSVSGTHFTCLPLTLEHTHNSTHFFSRPTRRLYTSRSLRPPTDWAVRADTSQFNSFALWPFIGLLRACNQTLSPLVLSSPVRNLKIPLFLHSPTDKLSLSHSLPLLSHFIPLLTYT